MPNTLRIKRRITGSAGPPAALANAELAFNEVNNTLYYGKGDNGAGVATSVIAVGGDGTFATKTYVDTAVSSADFSQYAKVGASNTFAIGFVNTFNGAVNLQGGFRIDNVEVLTSAAELNVLDSVTAGTAAASKALIVDANRDLANLRRLSLTSVNNVTITTPATGATLTVADGKTLTASNTLTFTGTDGSSAAFGAGGTVAYTGNTLAVFAATTSAQLAGVVSDDTGSGALVFGTSPQFTTSVTTNSTSFAVFNATATTVNAFGAATTLNIGAATGNTNIANNLVVAGDLTVNGAIVTINSTTLSVDDINIVLGDTASPTNATADGGGITLKGTTDKTLTWVNATSAWTSSEDFNLVTGKVYEINGATVLSATALGSGVVSSSLTSVGTITTGTWNGTAIAVANGGTGATTAAGAMTNLGLGTLATQNANNVLITGGSIDNVVLDGGAF